MSDPTQATDPTTTPDQGDPAAPPASDPAAADPATADDEAVEATELAQLRAERDALQAQLDARPATTGATSSAAPVDLSDSDQADRAEKYGDWPQEGGTDLPQPWDLRALNLHNAGQDLQPGARDDVSPIVVDYSGPILTSGSADPSVHELGRHLGLLGFDNSVSRGENPFGAVDQSVMQAVHAFRSAYGVEEDPSPYGGNTPAGRALAASHIGPWTREALRRAVEREERKAS